MKKILLTALAVMASLSLMAQGSVAMVNSAATLVKVKDKTTGVISNAGNAYSVGLWWAPQGTTDEAQFQFVTGSTVGLGVPLAGMFSGVSAAIIPNVANGGIAAGAIANVQVRGWANAAGSYANAVATSDYSGKSAILTVDTGDPTTVPAGTPGSLTLNGFQSFTLQVPEPSTIALGILGLAGLFVLRRRS